MQTDDAIILVVDDNEDNRRVLGRGLQRQGHQVVMAEDGRQAMNLMQQQPFDLVLLDIMMPEVNGYQVLERMKADAELCHLPVIVISALDNLDSVVRSIELGAEDYLPKPFNRVLLRARIDASLEKKRLRDQERAHLHAVQAANEAKNRFIAVVAHELRNAIMPIRGYLELLRKEKAGPLNDLQAIFVSTMDSSTERMTALIADLADISGIENGQLHLNLGPIAIARPVDEAVSALGAQIAARNQALSVEIPGDLPPVWADAFRVAQVLTNLLSNAHKYTPENGEIHIWAGQVDGQPNAGSAAEAVRVAVRDTGIGIPPAEQDKVFTEFFRSSDQRVHQVPGIGLGLSISKRLIEMQGGRIWFESEYGQGTTFHFTLPVAKTA